MTTTTSTDPGLRPWSLFLSDRWREVRLDHQDPVRFNRATREAQECTWRRAWLHLVEDTATRGRTVPVPCARSYMRTVGRRRGWLVLSLAGNAADLARALRVGEGVARG